MLAGRPPGSRRLLTPAEARERLGGVSYERLRRLVESGKIWCTRTPGGTRRYDAEDVEAQALAGMGA